MGRAGTTASTNLNGRTGCHVCDAEWVGQPGLCVTAWGGLARAQGAEAEEGGSALDGDIVSQELGAWAPEHHRPNVTSWLVNCVALGQLLKLAEPSVSKSVKWG